jgi:hypothetical protein
LEPDLKAKEIATTKRIISKQNIETINVTKVILKLNSYTQKSRNKILCYFFCFNVQFFFFWTLDFGLSWLTSLQFIQYHLAGFYKPTIPQSPPSHLRDYSTCNNARLEFLVFPQVLFQPLIQMNGA